MLLCIDIGNTNIKIGLFSGETLQAQWRIATDRANLADEYAVLLLNLFAAEGIEKTVISGCAISSVVPALSAVFVELVRRYFALQALVVEAGAITGMEIHTDYPAEVGADLVMNALAARHLYGAPSIVISFGTATTFVAISAAGHLEGVAIAPGLITSGDSLFRATSTLPQVALVRPQAAIGKNTIHSMQSGFIIGFTGLVKELVGRFQVELGGGARVIATGGMAALIAPETGVIDAIEPSLALMGLRLLYEMKHPNG